MEKTISEPLRLKIHDASKAHQKLLRRRAKLDQQITASKSNILKMLAKKYGPDGGTSSNMYSLIDRLVIMKL